MIWEVHQIDQDTLDSFDVTISHADEDEWIIYIGDNPPVKTSWVGALTQLDSLITVEEAIQDSAVKKDYTVYNKLCDMREDISFFAGE